MEKNEYCWSKEYSHFLKALNELLKYSSNITLVDGSLCCDKPLTTLLVLQQINKDTGIDVALNLSWRGYLNYYTNLDLTKYKTFLACTNDMDSLVSMLEDGYDLILPSDRINPWHPDNNIEELYNKVGEEGRSTLKVVSPHSYNPQKIKI